MNMKGEELRQVEAPSRRSSILTNRSFRKRKKKKKIVIEDIFKVITKDYFLGYGSPG